MGKILSFSKTKLYKQVQQQKHMQGEKYFSVRLNQEAKDFLAKARERFTKENYGARPSNLAIVTEALKEYKGRKRGTHKNNTQ